MPPERAAGSRPCTDADSEETSSSSSSEEKSLADTYLEDYDEAAANCIGVGDTAGDAFGFGLCWLLDIPRQQVTFGLRGFRKVHALIYTWGPRLHASCSNLSGVMKYHK